MAIEYNFTLDMDRSKRDNNIAYARTGDVDSVVINASLVLNGSPYTPSGTNAFFECITPNGHSVRASASKSGSTVSAEIPSAAFQAAGVINVAYFRFETGGSDNPTYVESTEPFAIIVREGIGDNIDAGDYIEEWRQLADSLDKIVKEVQQKATQAETAINEQKEEVDELKTQAQTAIAQDTVSVENAKTQAISDINATKEEVADAAEDVTAAGDKAISQFKTSSQQAISSFNTNGTSAINKFNTNANDKLDEVDGMITEAQGDVDAAITQLESETQNAIKVAQDALDGTTAANLQNAINRTLKLDIADMTNIPNNASLSSFTNVGSYCCKTASAAATIGDCPIDDSPFNMYVFSSATSGQVMQLVVPIDLQGKPTAEWHVRFGTSSAMDRWSVIGGGADIAAGLGIDVTGDAQKTVSLDTTAFYQHHEATDIIQGSTEVTGGGRIKELTVYGNTRQNLWVNPMGTKNGVTITLNDDGSITVSGTATSDIVFYGKTMYVLRPKTQYTFSSNSLPPGMTCNIDEGSSSGYIKTDQIRQYDNNKTFTTSPQLVSTLMYIRINSGSTVSGTYHVMLNEGSEPEPWCPPGLNSVDELSVIVGGECITGETHDVQQQYASAVDLPAPANKCLKPGTKYELLIGVSSGQWYFNEYISSTNVVYRGAGTYALTVTTNKELTATTVLIKTSTDDLCVVDYCYLVEKPSITPVDLDGHSLHSLPGGTRDELRVDGTGAVTLVQRVGVALYDGTSTPVASLEPHRVDTMCENDGGSNRMYSAQMCDKLPVSTDITMLPRAIVSVNSTYGISVYTVENPGDVDFVKGLAPIKMLYSLATPQKVELPGIAIPDLASPGYTVYASSNMQAEIEAEVVKVDYLPPSDVYTKAEVDKKIEDAGGMPDIVPVSQGGTGVTTAAAERNRLGLGNTTGAVPVANGGTGAANVKAAQYNLLAGMNASNEVVDDSATVVFAYVSGSAALGAVYKRKIQVVWDWIAGKIRSMFGFSSSNVLDVEHGGTGLNDSPSMLVDLTSTSAASVFQSSPEPGVIGVLPAANGGTGVSTVEEELARLSVYTKAEVDDKFEEVIQVQSGSGNIPDDLPNNTIYIQYV